MHVLLLGLHFDTFNHSLSDSHGSGHDNKNHILMGGDNEINRDLEACESGTHSRTAIISLSFVRRLCHTQLE